MVSRLVLFFTLHWIKLLIGAAIIAGVLYIYHNIKNTGKLEQEVKQYEQVTERKAKMDAVPDSTDAATIDSLLNGTF